MNTVENRRVKMVVFDWAGTTVDYGSSAPEGVFDKVFSGHGIHLTREEINEPMGMDKKTHIRRLLSCPSGEKQWKEVMKREWTEEDVNALYEEFEKTLHDVVADYSTVMEGVNETVAWLRDHDIRVGSTTGYTSEMMEQVIPAAKAGGYEPDCIITPDIASGGRPGPNMMFACMQKLGVYPPCTVVKAGDTVVDMQEGKNAGAWSVGILKGSNLLGVREEEYDTMDKEELAKRKEIAKKKYMEAGADFVIDEIRELPAVIEKINGLLGETK